MMESAEPPNTNKQQRMVIEMAIRDILEDILRRPKETFRMMDHLHRDLKMDSDDFSFLFVPMVSKRLRVSIPVSEWGATDGTVAGMVDLIAKYCRPNRA
jgi:acyl carrier protein